MAPSAVIIGHGLGVGGKVGGSMPYLEVILNTQSVGAGVTDTYTVTPRIYNVTASIPVGETVTIDVTGTIVITGS